MDFKGSIASALSAACALPAEELINWLETPPSPEMGDYAFPCFRLAKTLKKAPPVIAAELAGTLALPAGVKSARAEGGYLNFTLDKAAQAKAVLERVFAEGARYGGSNAGGGRNVCIDYSSVNIAKPFHIGHLPTTVIGASLYRIYNHLGFHSVGINHLGDWGTQVRQDDRSLQALGRPLARGGAAAWTSWSSSMCAIIRKWKPSPPWTTRRAPGLKKIEDGDAEALELFDWFKAITLKEVAEVYDILWRALRQLRGARAFITTRWAAWWTNCAIKACSSSIRARRLLI